MSEQQETLKFFEAAEPDAEWLVNLLKGRDWLTAGDILRQIGSPDTDTARRKLRATAEASEGRVAGGQKGYKLVRQMTGEEFHHYRNWMLSQARRMESRIVLSDAVFYAKNPVPA
jgi:hypothetical protein